MPQQEVQFGKYQLLERIAAGGMAEIYRALYQAAAGVTKPVVIKKILPHYAGNANFISMFVNEAKIVVGLSHGNIAQVFDFGEIRGEYFLAMEFVHGHPLSKVLRKARAANVPVLPIPFAVLITMEICKGLQYAHSRLDDRGQPLNIIHRDVSPQNIILSYEGQVKIVDFGIAKARNAGQAETESGAVKGKYVYFSPEQARGLELDARTDIFATGIVLYEMLCGKLPFEGTMMDVLRRIIHGEFPRPRAVNADIPIALERIALTALATDRTQRYQSAQALQDALAGYLYSYAPTFSSSSLSSLMSYLYERELLSEGIPVRVPPDFLEQMSIWRLSPADSEADVRDDTHADNPRAAGTVSGPRTRQTDVPTHIPERPSARNDPGTDVDSALVAPVPGRPSRPLELPGFLTKVPLKWLFIGLPLAAMLIAGAAVFSVGYLSGFAIRLTSSPSSALVLVDGHPASSVTPLLISGLSANEEHLIEVQAPGMKRWSKRISPERGATLTIHADLESDQPQINPPQR